jgi:hypothetical protein
LGNSLMVEQRTLTPLVLVRIQVPQPTFSAAEKAAKNSGLTRPT